MGENSALCLRFDVDTFSTRHAYTADVGWGAYAYLPRILQVAGRHGVKLQFCACGQGLTEYPFEHQAIRLAGHPLDSHLYSHRVMLYDDPTRVTEELVLTEMAFAEQDIPWSGIGATDMYPNGIDDQGGVQALLTERGYQWCSSKYREALPLEQMQPYWLNDFLLEIPCAGASDRCYWFDRSATVEGFIEILLRLLNEAKDKGLVYEVVMHPGVLAKFDPECEVVATVVDRAMALGVPLVTMDKISQWKIACRELPSSEAPTMRRYHDDEERWSEQHPNKVHDYIGGWRPFPNSRRPGVTINRFGLRGADCLRSKPHRMTRVVCIGDSCVFGPLPDDAPWPAQLQTMLDRKAPLRYQVLNAGVAGQTSNEVARRLPQLLKGLRPDVVLISVLANDLWQTDPRDCSDWSTFTPEEFIRNIQLSIDSCRKHDAKPVLMTVATMVPMNAEMTPFMLTAFHQPKFLGDQKQPAKVRVLYDRYNQLLRDLACANGIPCFDAAARFDDRHDDRRGRLFIDTCHMLREGNTEMAEIIAAEIGKQLPSPS